MQNIINSARATTEQENWYAALFVSLALPDICVALESDKTDGNKYAEWLERNLPQYKGFLSGNDCYALRYALLHRGKDDIADQYKREILEHYVFLTSGSHCNLFRECVFNEVKKSFLQLNVGRFCNDLCDAAQAVLNKIASDPGTAKRIQETIEIHEPGYTYMGVIRFG